MQSGWLKGQMCSDSAWNISCYSREMSEMYTDLYILWNPALNHLSLKVSFASLFFIPWQHISCSPEYGSLSLEFYRCPSPNNFNLWEGLKMQSFFVISYNCVTIVLELSFLPQWWQPLFSALQIRLMNLIKFSDFKNTH